MSITVEEAFEAIKDYPEFVCRRHDGLVSFDYMISSDGTFKPTIQEIEVRAYHLWQAAGCPESNGIDFWLSAETLSKQLAKIRCELRGITFDATTNELLSLPLHKFFNINQTAETQFHLLKNNIATIYEKYDGSMIHFFVHNKQVIGSTRAYTNTSQAIEATEFVKQRPELELAIRNLIVAGYTPIFEFVARHNQIVVEYKSTRLIYLISRCRKTGDYLSHANQFNDVTPSFSFPFCDIYNHLDKEQFEGYVCHLDNGLVVKAKTEWYMSRHRVVDILMRPGYKVYGFAIDGVLDDLIPLAPDRYKKILTDVCEEVKKDYVAEVVKIRNMFDECLRQLELSCLLSNVINFKSSKPLVDARLKRKTFAGIVGTQYRDNFNAIMALYSRGENCDGFKDEIRTKLMAIYTIKYVPRLVIMDDEDC